MNDVQPAAWFSIRWTRNRSAWLLALAVLVLMLPTASPGAEPTVIETDVCVYGGTSGGVVAAVQAARMGKSVAIAEPGCHLGGMTAGGLSAVDIGDPRSIGGIAREYFTQLAATVGVSLAWDKPLETAGGGPATGGAYAIEPHKAERLFDRMAREAGVAVHFHARLARVDKDGTRIRELVAEDGSVFRAKMFLDATYEGDLMAAAGVSYTLIREGNAKYGETYNGIHYADIYRPRTNHQKHVREGRRMVSDLVLTEQHTFGCQVAPQPVSLGSYGTDTHEIRRIVKDGVVAREGKTATGRGGAPPYPIGYAAIVPKAAECENLFVTFALSASHTAFSSIRMEPVFMATSQSAATAAALAIELQVPVQQVPYAVLRQRLEADGQVLQWKQAATQAGAAAARHAPLPLVDLSEDAARQVIVAQGTEEVYQGHPTTLLMPDGQTMFCVWTHNHGGPCGPIKRSDDGGRTWSDLLPVPESWQQVLNCPAIYRLCDPAGRGRLVVFAGQGRDGAMHSSVSEDEGRTWSDMRSVGLVCVMPFCSIVAVDGGQRLLGWTNIRRPGEMNDPRSNVVAQSESTDGGQTWSPWRILLDLGELKPCEPEVVRSPDGRQLLCLMRENAKRISLYMTSDDEGRTWSAAQPLPPGLFGDRHIARYALDGRLVVCFRDTGQASSTRNHFVAWVGSYGDILAGRDGQYRIKLLHSHRGSDCGYPGLERLPDGAFVATTYIKYRPGPEKHSVVSTRFTLEETDAMVALP